MRNGQNVNNFPAMYRQRSDFIYLGKININNYWKNYFYVLKQY